MVTHAQLDVVGMTVDHMKKAAAMGAKMELCAMLHAGGAGLAARVHAPRREGDASRTRRPPSKSVGPQHFVIGTDLGQTGNPTPADGLQMFVTGLVAAGITPAQIQTMGREIPGALLMG